MSKLNFATCVIAGAAIGINIMTIAMWLMS